MFRKKEMLLIRLAEVESDIDFLCEQIEEINKEIKKLKRKKTNETKK